MERAAAILRANERTSGGDIFAIDMNGSAVSRNLLYKISMPRTSDGCGCDVIHFIVSACMCEESFKL